MASQPETDTFEDRRPYSVPQLAMRWGCSQGLIRKMIDDGRLQSFRLGTLIRISATEVEKIECQNLTTDQPTAATPMPSNDSAAVSLSSGGNQTPPQESQSVTAELSNRKIGRARRFQ